MAGRQSDIDTMLLLSCRRRRRHTFTEKYCWILIKLNLKEFMRGESFDVGKLNDIGIMRKWGKWMAQPL